jgi:small conductance mechanosensitive channel
MQAPLPDTSAVLDSLAAADSLAAVDSLARAALDSAAAARDTLMFSDSVGIGRLGRDVGAATDLLTQGNVDGAAAVFLGAVWGFTVNNLLPGVLVGLGFWVLYRVLKSILTQGFGRSSRIDAGVEQLILRALRMVLASFGAITVLGQLGINVTALVAGLGIAGIAIGFAARDTLENLIAGVTLLLDRPLRVGDFVELQDTYGSVEEITLRTTRIRTLENQMAILPNAQVITGKILNHSMLGVLRTAVPFGIGYGESPAQARELVLALTAGDARLHPDFPPQVVVTDLADSAVTLELRLFLKDARAEPAVQADFREAILKTLQEAGVEIPFPHLQVHLDEARALESASWMTH